MKKRYEKENGRMSERQPPGWQLRLYPTCGERKCPGREAGAGIKYVNLLRGEVLVVAQG